MIAPVTEAGLSNGASYRHFISKDDIVVWVCEQSSRTLPNAPTAQAVSEFLEHMRAWAHDADHARLISQIYAKRPYCQP